MDTPKREVDQQHMEWEGLTLDRQEWCKRLGIGSDTMDRRLNRYRYGEISYPQIFRKPTKSYKETEFVKKTILYQYLRAFQKKGMGKLEEEMKTYMATGTKGPAMKWVEANKALLMNTKTQEHTKTDKPAQLAIFVGGDVPKNITVIEGGQ